MRQNDTLCGNSIKQAKQRGESFLRRRSRLRDMDSSMPNKNQGSDAKTQS